MHLRLLTTTIAAIAMLCVLPSAASAGYTSVRVLSAVAMIGNGDSDTLVITTTGVNLQHNRAGDGGFNSAVDFDSGMAGDQVVASNGTFSLTVNAGDGNDTVWIADANLFTVTVNGGAGDDIISGSAGGDTLNGEAGADTISGNAGVDALAGNDGDDVLDGGTENDSVSGDAGDDLFTFVDGDGSDVLEGGVGTDRFAARGSTADDRYTVAVVNGRTSIIHVLPASYTSSLGTIERIDIATGLGNDRVEVDEDISAPLMLDGGDGDDRLEGGLGSDNLFGGPGGDILDSRDAVNDLVDCGAGSTDVATIDIKDTFRSCESVTPRPQPAIVVERAFIGVPTAVRRLRSGKFRTTVPLKCRGDAMCVGKLELRTTRRIQVAGGLPSQVVLARVAYRIPAGATRSVTVLMPAGVRRYTTGVARRNLTTIVTAETAGIGGSVHRSTRRSLLVLPAR